MRTGRAEEALRRLRGRRRFCSTVGISGSGRSPAGLHTGRSELFRVNIRWGAEDIEFEGIAQDCIAHIEEHLGLRQDDAAHLVINAMLLGTEEVWWPYELRIEYL